jgi:hypothetical protein
MKTSLHRLFLMHLRVCGEARLRIELEHVRSGERVHVTTLAKALAWLEARLPPPHRRAIESTDEGGRRRKPSRPLGTKPPAREEQS